MSSSGANSAFGSVTDAIKQRIDRVELVARYVPLKKAGSTYKACCPFHSERTPSFVVFPQSGTWRCFGQCGVGGDAFSFLMKQENLDFREALQLLARETGVELRAGNGEAEQQRKSLYEINAAAAGYFGHILRHHPAAAAARDYLAKRGIDSATIDHFGLGFALDSWESLRSYLDEQGYAVEQQVEAGLLKHNEQRDSHYDAFRNRITIPIRDKQGRTLGFGGRVMDDGVPKYLNTAETPLFHKSHVVYGIDLAHKAIRDADQVVIVEGYMDVIAAHQHGFANVVACMGTALTSEQLQQLQRYTDNFVLALDADAAGQQATLRGLNQARQALSRTTKPRMTATGRMSFEERLSANLKIVSMPAGRDPDDVIRQDKAGWQTLVSEAAPLVDFYFRVVADEYDLTSAHGKGQAVADLAPLIAELGDEIEQQHYVQQLSRLVQVDELTINGRVQAAAKTASARQASQAHKRSEPGQTPSAQPQRPPTQSQAVRSFSATGLHNVPQEEYLLARLLQEPDLLVWLAGQTHELEVEPLGADDWQSVENQEIFRAFKRFIASDEQWDVELFQELLTEALHARLAELIIHGIQLPQCSIADMRGDVLKVLLRIRHQRLKEESLNIRYLMTEAQQNNDAETIRSFYSVNDRNRRELRHLQLQQARLNQTALFAHAAGGSRGAQLAQGLRVR